MSLLGAKTVTIRYKPLIHSAILSLIHSIKTGDEYDHYEFLGRVFGLPIDKANQSNSTTRRYFFGPQAHVASMFKTTGSELARYRAGDFSFELESDDSESEEESNEEEEEYVDDSFLNGDHQAAAGNAEYGSPQGSRFHADINYNEASASTVGSVHVPKRRRPDGRLSMSFLDKSVRWETIRYILGTMEVKLLTKKDMQTKFRNYTYESAVAHLIVRMLPQVFQAIQLAFHQQKDVNQLVGVAVVNEYCRFLYFSRDKMPEITLKDLMRRKARKPRTNAADTDGEDPGAWINQYTVQRSAVIKIVGGMREYFATTDWALNFRDDTEGDVDTFASYTKLFEAQWKLFLKWTQQTTLFPNTQAQ